MNARTGMIAPQQQRSRKKLWLLFTATDELMRQRPFDDLSIAEICQRAGVSTGTFYNRFESKDALLAALYADYWERHSQALESCLKDLAAAPALRTRLYRVVDYFLEDYMDNAGVLRSIILRWRRTPITGSGEHEEVVEAYRALARALAGSMGNTERAMYCLHIVVNLCRDFVLFPELLADSTLPEWRDNVRERLVDACLGLMQ